MIQVTTKSFSENNKAATVEIENFGTMNLTGFAQKLFNNGLIDFKALKNARKGVNFTSEYATKLVNQKPELFIGW